MLGASEAGHVSEPKKKSNKEDEIYEDSDEGPQDMIDEEPEEDPEEEIYEESAEDPGDVIEEEPEEHSEVEIDGESDEDPEEEIIEEPEEDSEEEINEESDEEELGLENSHLSSAMNGGTDMKDLGYELTEDSEEVRGKKVVEESGSHGITRIVEYKKHNLFREPVTSPSSMSDASKVGYELENASKFRSVILEACESQKKFLSEESLKLKPDGIFALREHDGEIGLSNIIVNECASKQQDHGGSSKKHRQSRWDHKQEGETRIVGNSKRRKTRWDNNDSQNGLFDQPGFISSLGLLVDPKIINLKAKLMEINKKLQSSEIYDERPEGERSPPPEPVYNNLGIRINTRDARIRKKLMNEKNRILSELASKTNLTLKSPAKHKPIKLVKKLFVPEKEYPTYNFIGLILGPKGNTQKKMEKETGAKIYLRGKGSGDHDSSDEDLHVRVEADSEQAQDAAVAMIEKLLFPVADQNNDHKKAQLVELAKLRGTYRDSNICDLCKEHGHRKYACPLQDSTFKAICCDICGSFGHSTSNCSVSLSHQICKTLQGSSGIDSSSIGKKTRRWILQIYMLATYPRPLMKNG